MKVLLFGVCLLSVANALFFGGIGGCCCGCGIPQPPSCGCAVRCPAPAPCLPPICPTCPICPPAPVCPPPPVAVCPQSEPVYIAQQPSCAQPPCQQPGYVNGGAGGNYGASSSYGAPQQPYAVGAPSYQAPAVLNYPAPPPPNYSNGPAVNSYAIPPQPEQVYPINGGLPLPQQEPGTVPPPPPQNYAPQDAYDQGDQQASSQGITPKDEKIDESQRKARGVATADDPKCNSKELKNLILTNIVPEDAVASKRAIHKAAVSDITDSVVDIICSDAGFTYIVSTAEHCEAQRDKVICFIYKKP